MRHRAIPERQDRWALVATVSVLISVMFLMLWLILMGQQVQHTNAPIIVDPPVIAPNVQITFERPMVWSN